MSICTSTHSVWEFWMLCSYLHLLSSTFFKFIYLFIWLCWVLVVASRIFSCGMHTLSCSEYVCAISLRSCPTLCDPMNCSPPGSSAHGILQARILKWVAIPFSRGPSHPRDWTWVSCIVGRRFTIWVTRDVWYQILEGCWTFRSGGRAKALLMMVFELG